MIPVPTLVAELTVGLGAALAGANLYALLRPRIEKRRTGKLAPPPASRARAIVNVVLGLVITAWGIATLLARG